MKGPQSPSLNLLEEKRAQSLGRTQYTKCLPARASLWPWYRVLLVPRTSPTVIKLSVMRPLLSDPTTTVCPHT